MHERLKKVRDALLTVTGEVYHYEAPGKKDRYIVWAEDTGDDVIAGDNTVLDQIIQGSIDYFTKEEYDTVADLVTDALARARIANRLNSCQYEKETGYIHYEWIFEV